MISIAEGIEAILAHAAPCAPERVALSNALGRFVASELVAREDVPGFDNSAMDGYAVRADTLVGAAEGSPVTLRVEGESRAGGPPPGDLAPDTAMRIFTGAPMPPGADAVVMQEDTSRDGDRVAIAIAPTPRRHVRFRGEVLSDGDPMLAPGAEVGPGEVGLLASQGFAFVPVHRRPRVAILSTGDELREIGDRARPGSLFDSNAHALAAAVREAGGVPTLLPLGADSREALTSLVTDGLLGADLLLTTGGVSVGEYDLLHEAFRDAGVEEVFWKVRIKPGKPLRFGARDGTPVIGLPGNPVSALVTFEVFVRPALRRMLGARRPFRAALDVTLARAIRAPVGRTELCRASLTFPAGSLPVATPFDKQGSAAITSLVDLDAYVVLPASFGAGGGERFEAGARLRALDVRSARGSDRHAFSE